MFSNKSIYDKTISDNFVSKPYNRFGNQRRSQTSACIRINFNPKNHIIASRISNSLHYPSKVIPGSKKEFYDVYPGDILMVLKEDLRKIWRDGILPVFASFNGLEYTKYKNSDEINDSIVFVAVAENKFLNSNNAYNGQIIHGLVAGKVTIINNGPDKLRTGDSFYVTFPEGYNLSHVDGKFDSEYIRKLKHYNTKKDLTDSLKILPQVRRLNSSSILNMQLKNLRVLDLNLRKNPSRFSKMTKASKSRTSQMFLRTEMNSTMNILFHGLCALADIGYGLVRNDDLFNSKEDENNDYDAILQSTILSKTNDAAIELKREYAKGLNIMQKKNTKLEKYILQSIYNVQSNNHSASIYGNVKKGLNSKSEEYKIYEVLETHIKNGLRDRIECYEKVKKTAFGTVLSSADTGESMDVRIYPMNKI